MKNYIVQRNPFVVPTTDGKLIEEHHGLATTGNEKVSVAHMIAPPGWSEPAQVPEFDEITYVIRGRKRFNIDGEEVTLHAGESIHIRKHTRIQYANPFEEECEYIAICLPAFSLELAHREDS